MSDTKVILRADRPARSATAGTLRFKDPKETRQLSWNRAYLWTVVLPGIVAILFLSLNILTGDITLKGTFPRVHQLLTQTKGNAGGAWLFTSVQQRDHFTLNGIVYSVSKPIAIINQQICEEGETFAVRVAKNNSIIHCLDIDPEMVRIRTAEGQQRDLTLR
jgi:hypothetical protein